MSNIVEQHRPCPLPDCHSTDAYCLYDDGHGYCFSCQGYVEGDGVDSYGSWIPSDVYKYEPHRGLTEQTLRTYDTRTHYHTEDGTTRNVSFPYGNKKKYRAVHEKKFWAEKGLDATILFGADKFPPNSGKIITITEGEYDAMAVHQMFGNKYPAVSISSSSAAKKTCIANRDYLNSFEKIYLCFDNDEPGRKAIQDVVSLFDFRKIFIVNLTKHKDANDYLVNDDVVAFTAEWWDAQRYTPENLISSYAEIAEILEEKQSPILCEYPYSRLQTMTYGIREGEVVLISGLEGIGKTEIIRSLEYHTLKETDHNIAIIHLEESQSRNIKGLVGYELAKPIHLPEFEITNEETLDTYKELCTREDRVYFYNAYTTGDTTPPDFLNTIRFLVTSCDCKIVFFDHITMLATGSQEDDERRLLDNLSTNLALMVDELKFALVMVTHINDNGQTRGSRNISKIADLHLQLSRTLDSEDEVEQNTTHLNILKNRFVGRTGSAGSLHFDPMTFRLEDEPFLG